MAKQRSEGMVPSATVKRAAPGPRPAYIGYRVFDSAGNPLDNVKVVINAVHRKADNILKHVTETGDDWQRFEIK